MCFFCISKFKYLLKIGLNFKLLILFLIDLLAYPPFHLLLILRYSLLKHTFAKCTDCGGTPCGVAALRAHCRCLHVRTGEAGGLAACQLSPDSPRARAPREAISPPGCSSVASGFSPFLIGFY